MRVISVDAMGGDFGPSVTVPACLKCIEKINNVKLILVGDADLISKHLSQSRSKYDKERICIHHASEKVEMDEEPTHALRFKKQSSMRVALELLKDGSASACVSAGNTGALVAISHYVVKTIVGISRPAIIASMPTICEKKIVRVCDLGANIECDEHNLYQFALMGSILAKTEDKLTHPRVALLNIGSEEIKGNEKIKKAAQMLIDPIQNKGKINYVGYVEGDKIMHGKVDVVVCDGFVGNIALKSMEGMAKLLTFYMKKEFSKNLFSKISSFAVRKILKNLKLKLDTGKKNGAALLGLRAPVIKSHGGADIPSFENAIYEAIREAELDIPKKIESELEKIKIS